MKKIFQKKNILKYKKGITVLIAALVASILLAIGLSIFNTTVKDLFFASTSKQSEIAFYAADTAAECAQYFDIGFPGQVFATSSIPIVPAPTSRFCVTFDITNPGQNASGSYWDPGTPTVSSATTKFKLHFPSPIKACAEVTVTKEGLPDGINSKTTISSFGYDTTCEKISNPRTVQRGIQFSY
ncbi:MAG: pilus assembly PilX N-terminal domain-containing protein [Candidatus Pacebacteria bacterium]|nr:pilus assembly PilX N-terminal domain-containing protein [Candidatus Paceibacterota bacterium]MDD5357090.1 pilus assembly PilX N-terminal domain-containing protein [Candidatus Paceibacterota bacterium]